MEFDDRKTIEEIIDGTLTYPGAEFVGIWKTDPFENSAQHVLYFSKGKKDSANYAKEIKSDFQKKDFIEWKEDRVDFGRVIFRVKYRLVSSSYQKILKFFCFQERNLGTADHFAFNLSHIHDPYFNMD